MGANQAARLADQMREAWDATALLETKISEQDELTDEAYGREEETLAARIEGEVLSEHLDELNLEEALSAVPIEDLDAELFTAMISDARAAAAIIGKTEQGQLKVNASFAKPETAAGSDGESEGKNARQSFTWALMELSQEQIREQQRQRMLQDITLLRHQIDQRMKTMRDEQESTWNGQKVFWSEDGERAIAVDAEGNVTELDDEQMANATRGDDDHTLEDYEKEKAARDRLDEIEGRLESGEEIDPDEFDALRVEVRDLKTEYSAATSAPYSGVSASKDALPDDLFDDLALPGQFADAADGVSSPDVPGSDLSEDPAPVGDLPTLRA
jgi:hypothetical protein